MNIKRYAIGMTAGTLLAAGTLTSPAYADSRCNDNRGDYAQECRQDNGSLLPWVLGSVGVATFAGGMWAVSRTKRNGY